MEDVKEGTSQVVLCHCFRLDGNIRLTQRKSTDLPGLSFVVFTDL
jgi:hypothetical protein